MDVYIAISTHISIHNVIVILIDMFIDILTDMFIDISILTFSIDIFIEKEEGRGGEERRGEEEWIFS